jgi:hypothetical protein
MEAPSGLAVFRKAADADEFPGGPKTFYDASMGGFRQFYDPATAGGRQGNPLGRVGYSSLKIPESPGFLVLDASFLCAGYRFLQFHLRRKACRRYNPAPQGAGFG